MKLKQYTLRRRLLFLFSAVIGFFCILALSYILCTFALKNDLVTLEDFYTLFNNVLEVRRYEKNLLFNVGLDNYEHLLYYLQAVELNANQLNHKIIFIEGKEKVDLFFRDLNNYSFLIKKGYKSGKYNREAIRKIGQRLVDFSKDLLNKKRIQIHKTLHLTMMGFLLATASVFMFVLLIFYYHYKLILGRILILQKATEEVAKGTFTPIPEKNFGQDEISALIHAFNRMVQEIDSKQEQLLQARKLAAIGTFSSGIAHELNNPLNNILLTADTLQEEYNSLSEPEVKELVSDIVHQTERASNIVKNLLDFCRETEPEQALLNIQEVINKTIKLIKNQLKVQKIKLENLVPDDLPLIMGDMHKLQQVFLNLFVNAIQAMKEGGLIKIVGQVDPRGYVRIDFSDTGCGIDEKNLKRIFDPFFTTKGVGHGTGLGLSIVYGIIKKHGGYIEVHSEVGKGTTFSIYLPAAHTKKQDKEEKQ